MTDIAEKLLRWESAGGFVEVDERSADVFAVVLTSCDGVEMERLNASAGELQPFLDERSPDQGRSTGGRP